MKSTRSSRHLPVLRVQDPGVPWGRLIGALVLAWLSYMTVRNYPQAVRYLKMRQM